MSNESSELESSSLSIIQKFLDSEIRGEMMESKESPQNNRKTKRQFNFETILKDCKKRHENNENSDVHFQISELKLEQQNFEAELEFIQKQLIQEINFLIKKIMDKNQLFYKQQELQLQQVIQKRCKQSSPYQSNSLFYVMNPNLQQYQQYNKEIKENLAKLLSAIKQDKFAIPQSQQPQTSRSPLSQLSKLIQRQASIEKPNNISTKMKNNYQMNLVLPSRRDTQSFWNQPSDRKCSVARHSPYEKKEKGNVQQALFKQSSDFLKFRC